MEANRISAAFRWSRRAGKLVGILTNRDVRFADNPAQPVRELMTHENLATVPAGVSQAMSKAPAAPTPDRKVAGGR
jgi:IMP dehydrogenase